MTERPFLAAAPASRRNQLSHDMLVEAPVTFSRELNARHHSFLGEALRISDSFGNPDGVGGVLTGSFRYSPES